MKPKHQKPMLPRPKDAPDGKARRSFLKAATAAMAAPLLLTSRKSSAGDDEVVAPVLPPSPATTPWVQELPPAITPLAPVLSLNPLPQGPADIAEGECGRNNHQRWQELVLEPGTTELRDDLVLYELMAKENKYWQFNPAYPPQSVWGYGLPGQDATTPGPTFFARYGHPVICRIHNGLPQDHKGFGTPEISTHLHNLHTPSESDGFAGNFYSVNKAGPTLSAPGEFNDHFYPNVYAGLEEFGGIGDPREALGTLFYHDHTMDFTAPNVYRGLSGFYLLFDDLDSGNENLDPANPGALRLPSHPYDYPLNFGDRRFDANGMLTFDQVNPEGVLGDKVVVNGKIEPYLKVARRKYRFRLLNSGPSRFYEFYLVSPGNVAQAFTLIGNDGNLLPAPAINQTKVRLGVAERSDIVVDFSRYPVGTVLYFVNKLRQELTRKPKDVKEPGTRVLKFIVNRNPPVADVSRVPSVLRPLRPLSSAEIAAAPVVRWVFERANGMWAINGKFFDARNPRRTITKGKAEVWELVNPDDGWAHPIHIHFEEGRILSKIVNGVNVPVPIQQQGRKDVYVLEPNSSMRVFLRFRDFTGKYLMHCHNMIHEDHAMMLRWDIKES